MHRLGGLDGEIVYAFKTEIAAWERPSAEARESVGTVAQVTQAAPGFADVGGGPRRRRWVYALALALVLAAVAVGMVAWRASPPLDAVAEWSVEGQMLTVLGPEGQHLWTHQFDVPIRDSDYASLRKLNNPAPGSRPVQFVDVNGDGRREVLVRVLSASQSDDHLLCLDADGREQFRFKLRADVWFGDTEYSAPWLIYGVFPVRNGDGSSSVWAVFTHGRWFPSAVIELDRAGTPKQTYWSNGFVSLVKAAVWNGRERIVIGAANNENRAASLAVFPRDRVLGSAPAINRQYRCTTCVDGIPEEFLVFPGACLVRARDGTADVMESRVEAHDRLAVLVTHGVWEAPWMSHSWRPGVWYEFDRGLRLDKLEVTTDFRKTHDHLHRTAFLDHPFDLETHTGLPVLRWDKGQFREVDTRLVPE